MLKALTHPHSLLASLTRAGVSCLLHATGGMIHTIGNYKVFMTLDCRSRGNPGTANWCQQATRFGCSMVAVAATMLLPLLPHLTAASAAPTTMATLPAGSVAGVLEALTVLEDLLSPGSPIIFSGASGLRFELPKSGGEHPSTAAHC